MIMMMMMIYDYDNELSTMQLHKTLSILLLLQTVS